MINKTGIVFGKVYISWVLIGGLLFSSIAYTWTNLYIVPQIIKNRLASQNSNINELPEGGDENADNDANNGGENGGRGKKSPKSTSSPSSSSSDGNSGSNTPGERYNLCALGDSITNAANMTSSMVGDYPLYSFSTGTSIQSVYKELLAQGANINPVKLAVSGHTSGLCASSQAPQVSGYDPKYITLLIGGNDLLQYKTPDEFSSNLNSIASQIAKDGRKVLIGTLPNFVVMKRANIPSCEPHLTPVEESVLGWALGDYNASINSVASAYGFTVVNLYPHLDEDDISTYDCVHLSPTGNSIVASLFRNSL